MTNFNINFSNPWLLLLLIPAVLLTLIPYLRMNKRYRRTRNRIASMTLHILIMVLSVTLLAGIRIDYDLPNEENEVILLVDASFSGENSQQEKNEFVEAVINNNRYGFKLGIVTFGYDQVYAVPLTHDMSSVYTEYLKAPSPDETATDIESALNYAAGLFEYPESARIVLISDATETDGHAEKTIKAIAAKGIKVDTVYFPEEQSGDEVQILSMERPEDKIKVGESFEAVVTIQSSYSGSATLIPYDNGVQGLPIQIELKEGPQTVEVPFEFALPGMHKMSFELESNGDTLEQNNIYNAYIYLEIFDKILVIESLDNESEAIVRMLDEEMNATVISIKSSHLPMTLDELCEYDEIILCNVSNSDMPDGFDQLLYSYVHDVGGGLFTVCGNKYDADPYDENWTANAYTREDMYDTLYQDMLPVEVINYTPPTAVMIIIDRSGSMTTNPDGTLLRPDENKLLFAKQGAVECVELLSERDYVGIMSFADDVTEHLPLTARTQRDKILASIEYVDGTDGGGTVLSIALEKAGMALNALSNVENRHIIIITDGEPSAQDQDRYKSYFEKNAAMGITTSIVGVQCTTQAKKTMTHLLVNFAGMTAENYHEVNDLTNASSTIKKDFEVNKIKDVNYETFTPKIDKISAITQGIKQEDMPTLDGFYGVKTKEGAEVILMGKYTPIYAQWGYGEGRVGTFACDLNGTWSSNFIDTEVAKTLLNNIVMSLFPEESIRAKDIELEVEGENYTTNLSIYTELNEGETIVATVTAPSVNGADPEVQKIVAGANDSYTRMKFVVRVPGIHEIRVQKLAEDGKLISETVTYKAFSYSGEYNVFTDPEIAAALAETLAADGKGFAYNEPWQVFEHSEKYRHVTIDPRIAFMIALIALFLLDIAVRKFKWKWIHEIIRDKKAQKSMYVKK